jgi:hypothetical protein
MVAAEYTDRCQLNDALPGDRSLAAVIVRNF